MSSVPGPYGLVPARKYLGDTPFSSGMHTYPILSNPTVGMFFGDPVGITAAGQVVPLTTSPAPGTPPLVLGVFYGCEYQDPIRGFVNAQQLPANVMTAGAWNVRVKVFDYPWAILRVQADGPVDYTAIGQGADLSVPPYTHPNPIIGSVPSGNVWTGNSMICLTSASIGSGSAVRIYDLVVDAAPSPGAGSLPGDPYTDCLVIWNMGVSRWLSAT